jgi:hypothetical protein
MVKRLTMLVVLLMFLWSPALGEKIKVDLAGLEFNPSTAKDVLDLFTGRVKKLKTINSGKPKSTITVELTVDGGKANTIGMICEEEGMFVKGIGFPYSALVMVLPTDGKFPSGRKINKVGEACMSNWVPGIQGMSASRVKKEIFQEGVIVSQLFLISYREKGSLHSDMPTKIGP